MSTVFQWDNNDIEDLLASCETDGLLPYIKKYFPQGAQILESGCGLGRYVRYMQDRGWHMTGLEIDPGAVKAVKKYWPDLKIVEGDAANSPFKAASFDGIISLGVIEHWTEGPEAPLKDMLRILKPGGIALITVPCMSGVRKLKRALWWNELITEKVATKNWRKNGGAPPNRKEKKYKYWTYPTYGEFFEYRFTKAEFSHAVTKAGLEIIEHKPSAIIDGLYHELNPGKKFAKFERWQFKVSPFGRLINNFLSVFPFFHSHMQLIIARKPLTNSKKS